MFKTKFARVFLMVCLMFMAMAATAHAQKFLVVMNAETYANIHNKYTYNAIIVDAAVKAGQNLGVNVEVAGINPNQPYALQPFLNQNNALIITIGYDICVEALALAKDNPDQKFALVDFEGTNLPVNVCAYSLNGFEAAYLAGYWAALAINGNTVGFIGGEAFPSVVQMGRAFVNGALAAKPGMTAISLYINDFFSPQAGGMAAQLLYDEGAEVVFAAAGQSGYGLIEAAVANNKLAVGVDADQYPMAPGHVLTSVVLNMDEVVLQACQSVINQNFAGGEQIVMNLANNGVYLGQSNFNDYGVLDKVKALQNDVIAGKIVIMPHK